MSVLNDLANAVKEQLNATAFSLEFTATRSYLPVIDLEDAETLHVTVVPRGRMSQVQSRGKAGREYRIDIGVQKRVTPETLAELDALCGLVEELIEAFEGRRAPLYGAAVCTKIENDPAYWPEHLNELRQFTSVVTLTFITVE